MYFSSDCIKLMTFSCSSCDFTSLELSAVSHRVIVTVYIKAIKAYVRSTYRSKYYNVKTSRTKLVFSTLILLILHAQVHVVNCSHCHCINKIQF